MVYIRKSINIISPSDGKHYDSLAKYEKSLDQKGQHIMSEGDYKRLREKLIDESNSVKKEKKRSAYSHVHIDLNNDMTNVISVENIDRLNQRLKEAKGS